MNSPVPVLSPRSHSQAGGRRPPVHLHSDCPPEPDEVGLTQRSVSLTTLQPTVIQPRMAQLETLEAKMASIEVSLSNTPRRKKNGCLSSVRSIPKEVVSKELENLRNALRDKENIIQSLKGQLTIPGRLLSTIRSSSNGNLYSSCRELTEIEKKQAEERLSRLKTDVDNKRLTIKNLKMALERLDITDNIDVRIQQAELEYQLGREELNLLTLLEETRALQLCLEESNKNSESHTLFSCVSENGQMVLLGIEVEYDSKNPKFGAGQRDSGPGLWIDWALPETGLCKGDRLVEVNGKIVLMRSRDDLLRLLAAAPDPAQIVIMRKPPEHDNKANLDKTYSEVAALREELEAVRERADEAQKTKDGLKSDNIRLTHRISYLEEHVAELLNRKKPESLPKEKPQKVPIISTVKTSQNVTNINITSQAPSSNTKESVQIFQKGPQVTTLVANIPGLETKDGHQLRPKSSLSSISNTQIMTHHQNHDSYHCFKSHRHRHKTKNLQTSISVQNLDQNYRKQYNYGSETNSNIDKYNRRNSDMDQSRANSEKDYNSDIMNQSYKKATKIVQELTRNGRDSSLYEKHRQKCITASEKYNGDLLKHYNARKSTSVLDFRSGIHIGTKYMESKSVEDLDEKSQPLQQSKKIMDARSVKSLDFDSDCNSTTTTTTRKTVDYTSEPLNDRKLSHYSGYYSESTKPRPTPPKKPIRLSLHKTQSLQSVETSSSNSPSKNESRKSLKRNYKGELPRIEQTRYSRKFDSALENGSWC